MGGEKEIGVMLTQSNSGDELTIFVKDLKGVRLEADDVIKLITALDIKLAMSKLTDSYMVTHPIPKGVM